jgi:dUTP pyrophosphatase
MTTITEKSKENEKDPAVSITVWPYVDELIVAKLEEDAILPTRKHDGDAGTDFYALQNVLIGPREMKVVRTGITVQLPYHYFGLMKPKGGSDNLVGAGVVDPDYQGEILFKIYNPSDDPISFLAGQPLGQMVLVPIVRPPVVEVGLDEIHQEETERGATGGILEDGE